MIEFFRSACLALRQGATLRPEVLASARLELQRREAARAAAVMPPIFAELLEVLRESLTELTEVLDGLELASWEDAPELAGWLNLRAQNAWERMLSVDQQLGDFYGTLDEEMQHGNR